ncbi:hypothetical protein EV426DRAFT_103119 [Tirmania nivea]|nr:hypothetical protein EV426DRAFT_103119 [Tirmania nivea]
MPPKLFPMSDTRSPNPRAHSAPAYHNTNTSRTSYVGSASIGNQPQFAPPAQRGPSQTALSSSLMGPPTMTPPSVTGQTQGRSDIQARFDEIYFTSPLPRSISNIYNTLQTQPQAALSSPSTTIYQQLSTSVPQAHPGASQSYHALAQNINPNTGFRPITQAATQTFTAARQLVNAPTQTFGGVGPSSAPDPGVAAVGFQTYTTENGIKVYVGPFANAYAYFGLTPPNMHTAEMAGRPNNTHTSENLTNTHVTDTANTLASAGKEPVTPPRSQGQALSPSPAYSPILTPVLELQKVGSSLKKSVTPETLKAKKKPQKKAKATEAENEPIVQVLEVQQEAKPSNESMTSETSKAKSKSKQKVKVTEVESEPISEVLEVQQEAKLSNESLTSERTKTDVKGKGKAKQTDTEPETAVFGTKRIIHPRTQPKVAAATDKFLTTPATAASVVTMNKNIAQKQMPENMATVAQPESDVGQIKKKGKAAETKKVPPRPQALIESLHFDTFEFDDQEAKSILTPTNSNQQEKGINTSQPVTTRTTISRNLLKAKDRIEKELEAPEVGRSSSRRSSGRVTLTPRPWWVVGSSPVTMTPVRAKSGSVEPPSLNGKRKRSARNEEQDEQATEQHARKSRTRCSASGIVQSDSVGHPSWNKNVPDEEASTREDQAIQDQIIDVVIQEHDPTTAANGSDGASIKSEDEYEYNRDITSIQEYHSPAATTEANDSEAESIKSEDESLIDVIQEPNGQDAAITANSSENETVKSEDGIIREHNSQGAAVAAYDFEEVSIKGEDDEYEAYQTSDGLDESIIVYEEEEIQEFTDESNWEQEIENESQHHGEGDLVDYGDLPQSPQRLSYPRIGLYPPNPAYYDVLYNEDDSPEYHNHMRRQVRRHDDDVQSRSPQYSEDGYQPQHNENEYQPQDFDDGSGEYSDLPENPYLKNEYQEEHGDGNWGNSDELPQNHHYHPEIQGAIFDSSSSDPFQSPGRGRALLQNTRRPFTGLSPAGPRETPPPRQPSTSPRKRKRLLWRENGREELIHPDSPRYLPFLPSDTLPSDALSSPGRGRTLLQGTRRSWVNFSPRGPRKTPPPREPSSSRSPIRRKRARHLYLHRQEGADELVIPPFSPFYAISSSAGPPSEDYDGTYQPTEREMNRKNGIFYIDLVSDSSDSDIPLPRTPPPRVWPKSNVMGKRNLKKKAPIIPLKPSGNGVSKHADKKGKNVHKGHGNSVSPAGRPSPLTREAKSASESPQPAVEEAGLSAMRKYNFRRSRTVEAKETGEVKPNDTGVSSENGTTSKSKGRETPQPPSPKSTRVTRSGAIGKIAGGNTAKSRGRK